MIKETKASLRGLVDTRERELRDCQTMLYDAELKIEEFVRENARVATERDVARKTIASLDMLADGLKHERDVAVAARDEARRRTIPFKKDARLTLNFLPVNVLDYKPDGRGRFVVTILAEVQHPDATPITWTYKEEALIPNVHTFSVALASYGNKINAIKAMRTVTGLGLKDAMDLVNGVSIIAENAGAGRAKEIEKVFSDHGCVVRIY